MDDLLTSIIEGVEEPETRAEALVSVRAQLQKLSDACIVAAEKKYPGIEARITQLLNRQTELEYFELEG